MRELLEGDKNVSEQRFMHGYRSSTLAKDIGLAIVRNVLRVMVGAGFCSGPQPEPAKVSHLGRRDK